jgi:hypothetical protein
MAGSNWNHWHDALLAADKLTPNESRLAHALARLMLGWNMQTKELGNKLIRDTCGNMDGRSFERARAGLIKKGLLVYQAGSVGKGNRSTYTLMFSSEKTTPPRSIKPAEKTTPARSNLAESKDRAAGTQKTAVVRPRTGSGKGKTQPSQANEIRRQAFDAYESTGGSLQLERQRNALAQAVTAAVNTGTETALILTACKDLGRNNAFPGYLKQRINDIQANGGPCTNTGANRSQLTRKQLNECDCQICAEWAQVANPVTTAEKATA